MSVPPATSRDRSADFAALLPAVVPALVALASRATALVCGFAMDDAYNIVGNPALRSLGGALRSALLPWGAAADDSWTHGLNAAYWRPVTTLFWALQTQLFGLRPAGWHAVSLLLHAGCASLLAAAMRRLGIAAWPAAMAASWWAAHAVHAETVTLTTYQTELLATLFAFALLHHAAGERDGGRPVRLAVFFALALGSKESGAAAAVVWAALAWVRARGEDAPLAAQLRRFGPGFAALAAVGAVWLGVRSTLVDASALPFFAALDPSQRLASVGVIVGHELGWMLLPWPLAPFWDQTMLAPALSWATPAALAGWGSLALLLLVGVTQASVRPWVALGALWWIAGLLPTMHFVPLPVGAAERFVYLASGGVALLLANALHAAWQAQSARWRLAAGAVAAWVLVLGAGSALRALDFRDDETLHRATVRDHPEGFSGWHYLGTWLLDHGRAAEAKVALDRAAEILPDFPPNERLRAAAAKALGSGQAPEP